MLHFLEFSYRRFWEFSTTKSQKLKSQKSGNWFLICFRTCVIYSLFVFLRGMGGEGRGLHIVIQENSLTRNCVSPQIAKEANLPCPYRTTLSQLRSSFCRSLHSYPSIPNPIPLPFLWKQTHNSNHTFLLPLTSNTPDRERPVGTSAPDVGVPVWHSCLWSPSYSSPPHPEPPPSNGQAS